MELLPLNLREVAQLYDILDRHLPDSQDMTVLELLKHIILSMGNTEDYAKSMELMTKMNSEELIEIYKPRELVDIFKNALVINRVFDLKRLFRS